MAKNRKIHVKIENSQKLLNDILEMSMFVFCCHRFEFKQKLVTTYLKTNISFLEKVLLRFYRSRLRTVKQFN